MRSDSIHNVPANLAAIPSFADMEKPILDWQRGEDREGLAGLD